MEEMLSALQEKIRQALKWSERYTKTDMVYLAGNGFWLALGHAGIGLTAFALSIAFARFVPKDVYGTYRFLLSVFWTLTAFSLTGVTVVLTRAVAQGLESAYKKAIRLSVLFSMPMMLIALGIAAYYFLNGNDSLGWGLVVIALIGPFMQAAYMYAPYLEGKRAFKENAFAGIALNFLPALALIASMFLTREPFVFVAVYLGASVLSGILVSWYVYRKFRPRDTGTSEGFAGLSGHFSAMYVLSTISQQVDRLLVFHYIGAIELAVYTFATAMPDQIKTVFNNVSTVALPKFVRRTMEEIKKTLWFRVSGFTILVALATGAYILVAPYLFHVFFPAYPEAVLLSQLYALSLIPIGSTIPLAILEAHALKRNLYIMNIVGPLVQIGLLFAFILWYGLMGVILARILARVFNLGLGLALVRWWTPTGSLTDVRPVE